MDWRVICFQSVDTSLFSTGSECATPFDFSEFVIQNKKRLYEDYYNIEIIFQLKIKWKNEKEWADSSRLVKTQKYYRDGVFSSQEMK